MDDLQLQVLESLDSVWFFSNVFSPSKTKPISVAAEPESPALEDRPEEPEIRSPPNSPQVVVEEPEICSPETPKSSPRRRRMRRSHRCYSERMICREQVNLGREGQVWKKDERAMKKHLKTWAVAVASSASQNSRTMVALCC